MQDAVEPVAHHLGQRRGVEDVDIHKRGLRRHGPVMALREIVGHGDGVTGLDQLGRHNAADVARPTHHEKLHPVQAIGRRPRRRGSSPA
jgi:hypothetical protein